jgi:dihydrofolate reductase
MALVFTFMSASVDGYICGPNGGPGGGLADDEPIFDWLFNGHHVSRYYPDFKLTSANAAVVDAVGARIGAVVAGRNTYEHSARWGGAGPHPTARLFVLSHEPIHDAAPGHTVVTDGIESALLLAKTAAGRKDVALMGGATITAALRAGLLDEIMINLRPVLLGGGTPLFGELPHAVTLEPTAVTVVTSGVTHLTYRVLQQQDLHQPADPS